MPVPLRLGVQAACRRWRMFAPGSRALVAVSGGPDSVALLHVLHELAGTLEIGLGVAHLNHGIRGASADRDEEFVRQLARRLGLPLHLARRDVPRRAETARMSIEEAARAERYALLTETANSEGYARIATGHTADDQAETVLLALLRGSGITGLGGMPPVLGQVARPLIESTRADVLAYLAGRGADYCHDETNDDLTYTRNRVRHMLLPMLEREFNPNIRATLARNALLVQEEDAWLHSLAAEFLTKAGSPAQAGRGQAGAVAIDREALVAAPPALRRRALREAARELIRAASVDAQGPAELTAANVEDLVNLLASGRTGARLDLPGLGAELGYRELVLRAGAPTSRPSGAGGGAPSATPANRGRTPGHDVPLDVPGSVSTVEVPLWDIAARVAAAEGPPPQAPAGRPAPPETGRDGSGPAWQVEAGECVTSFQAYLDLDRLAPPLRVRTRRRGDRFWPHGAPGERKLKDFLIDSKVPRTVRDLLPVVYDGTGRVCAVLPLRAADWATVGPATQRVLVLVGRIVTTLAPAPGVDREHPA